MAKATFNKNTFFVTRKLYLHLWGKNSEMLPLGNGWVWCWNLDNTESRPADERTCFHRKYINTMWGNVHSFGTLQHTYI